MLSRAPERFCNRRESDNRSTGAVMNVVERVFSLNMTFRRDVVVIQPGQVFIKYDLKDENQDEQRRDCENDSTEISYGSLFFQELSLF